MVAVGAGGGAWEQVSDGDRVSVLQDENSVHVLRVAELSTQTWLRW